jgi:hypothetical protein
VTCFTMVVFQNRAILYYKLIPFTDTLLTLTDKNGSATRVKLKLKLFLVCDAMMDTTQTVDTYLNDDDGLAAASGVVCQALQSLQQIVDIVDAIAEVSLTLCFTMAQLKPLQVYAICKVAWSMLSCTYNVRNGAYPTFVSRLTTLSTH